MSLQKAIQKLQENFLKDVPPDVIGIILQPTADLKDTGIAAGL